jgi:hypothetical protein
MYRSTYSCPLQYLGISGRSASRPGRFAPWKGAPGDKRLGGPEVLYVLCVLLRFFFNVLSFAKERKWSLWDVYAV